MNETFGNETFGNETLGNEKSGLSDISLADSEPVILLGRGGSGTRLLSEIALPLGVFLGNELNVSSDSVEWVGDMYALAQEVLVSGVEAGGQSDHAWRVRLRARARTMLAAGGRQAESTWGWKLPETMLVLPQVLRAFPKARVIHMVRHPLTSAWRRSHVTSRPENPIGRAVLDQAYSLYGFEPATITDDEVWFHNAITWRYQVENAQAALAGHDPSRVLLMRYEDLCAFPDACRKQLASFLKLPDTGSVALPRIDPQRTGTTPTDEAAHRRIWALCGALAGEVGYNQDVNS